MINLLTLKIFSIHTMQLVMVCCRPRVYCRSAALRICRCSDV